MSRMNLLNILKSYYGYDSFRVNQEEIINAILHGQDCLVLMPTGGGKSLCYQIPAIAMPGTAIIISPLISLMKDQVKSLKANGIDAAALHSGNDFNTNTIVRRKCIDGTLKLLYISPEKLLTEIPFLLKQMKISLFAIDEAHCISQWGHDFRLEYTKLSILHQKFPCVPIIALTATADKITQQDILKQLQLKAPIVFVSSFDRPNLSLTVKRGYSTKEKDNYIVNFIKAHPLESGIIYCLSRKATEKVANYLLKNNIRTAIYHAGLSQDVRDKAQLDFQRDDVQVICATIAFGMGIDKSNVRWIIHYNLPKSIESFYQEIGRAGRDGAPADTILFYSLADIVQLSQFAKESGQKNVNSDKLHRMQEYAESNVCRRRILLNYFGEQRDYDCNNCDVCEHPPRRFDGTTYIQMALSAVRRTGETIRTTTIIEILKGIASPIIKRNGYEHLKTFGVGKALSINDWQDYLLQMLQMGYIEIAYNQGNIVRITESGKEVLYGRKTAELCVINHAIKEIPKPLRRLHLEIPTITIPGLPKTIGMEDKKLFEALRTLRRQCAEEEGFPPYIIFSDKVLHALATIKPVSLEAFGYIQGIGDHKKKKYGQRFLTLIQNYV